MNHFFKYIGLMCFFVVFSISACEEEHLNFASDQQAQAYYELIREFRCVTCPNQSLNDSSMPVAQGMKAEIYKQIRDQKTVSEIKAYFIARYGKGILYRPPLDWSTLVLWSSPFILLILIFVVWRKFMSVPT